MATTLLHQLTASESVLVAVPSGYRPDGTTRAVVDCHGATQDSSFGSGIAPLAQATGCVWIFPDLFGSVGTANASWGNDSSLTKVTNQWNAVCTQFGCKSDKMILSSISMGAATALMYMIANPTKVVAYEATVPSLNVEDIRANNRLSQQANIEAAYVNLAGWNAVKAARDPYLTMSTHASQGIPMLLQYGDSDPVCLPQYATDFGAAVPNAKMYRMPGTAHATTGFNDSIRTDFIIRYRR